MDGATALVRTFLGAGVDTVFANPGTSEMHLVAALDDHPDMRCVLALFEGGATGAADGHARMTGGVGAVLLHLGPGFGNGWANLHNARKAGVGLVAVVGDHARRHLAYDAPLKADLEGVARSVSHWVRVAARGTVGTDGAAAVRAAAPGRIATLVLPADAAWSEGDAPAEGLAPPEEEPADRARAAAAAELLARPGAALMLDGRMLWGEAAETAGRIAARTGCRLMAPHFCARIRRGAGAVAIETLAYRHAGAREALEDVAELVLLGARHPVNFFAYPDLPSTPLPAATRVTELCPWGGAAEVWLAALAEAVGVTGQEEPPRVLARRPEAPRGALTAEAVGAAVARALPEEAIFVNEAISLSAPILAAVEGAAPHDRLDLTGGAIGDGLPVAVGAAVACPGRRVVAVVGDGSAMYTIQCLWTMARERLDVTVVILANRGYRILQLEMEAMGKTGIGRNARAMMDVADPELDFVALARGHGVEALRVETGEALEAALAGALAVQGPRLIEAVL
ncbi:acetolactate synthase large subunit [Histidinibacterium lentulum]|uniref:Acetolactate synthase large subunit n=1 Tax=Histidinibacterium lentulum TaxID=2480588 RepID=A0A3N2R512_9RHOB|nr:acetolactate synthase large subunit [Histidinibacterium lentulum]ROU02483.1 acetolactate synthase large subunit [Histidinibacterium lentulum]